MYIDQCTPPGEVYIGKYLGCQNTIIYFLQYYNDQYPVSEKEGIDQYPVFTEGIGKCTDTWILVFYFSI